MAFVEGTMPFAVCVYSYALHIAIHVHMRVHQPRNGQVNTSWLCAKHTTDTHAYIASIVDKQCTLVPPQAGEHRWEGGERYMYVNTGRKGGGGVGGIKRGREREREGGRKGGNGNMEGRREGGREGERERGKEGGREGGRVRRKEGKERGMGKDTRESLLPPPPAASAALLSACSQPPDGGESAG